MPATNTNPPADVAQTPSTIDHAPVVTSAGTVAITPVERHEEASVLGLDATMWVALSMIFVIGLMVWKRVPAFVTGALDRQIAAIRTELERATALRIEAEALRAEYQVKAAAAESEAAAIMASAHEEAADIVATAERDVADLIVRRGHIAEDKIATAERAAIAEVRARAASAAAGAAATIIAARHDATADKTLIDRTIGAITAAHLN